MVACWKGPRACSLRSWDWNLRRSEPGWTCLTWKRPTDGRSTRSYPTRSSQPAAARTGGPRVALVTGGTRGIGLGCAEALAREGWSLAVCGVRSGDRGAARDWKGSRGRRTARSSIPRSTSADDDAPRIGSRGRPRALRQARPAGEQRRCGSHGKKRHPGCLTRKLSTGS